MKKASECKCHEGIERILKQHQAHVEVELVEGEKKCAACTLGNGYFHNDDCRASHPKLPEAMFYIEEPIALSVEVVGYLNDTADKINQIIRYLKVREL